jgi:hypothetical protein
LLEPLHTFLPFERGLTALSAVISNLIGPFVMTLVHFQQQLYPISYCELGTRTARTKSNWARSERPGFDDE